MEAIERYTPTPAPTAVHSLVRRSMDFIERHLGEVPSHGNRRLELSQLVGLLLSAAMQPTVRSLRLIEQHSAGPEAREITGRAIVPRSTLSDALAAFDPEALRPVIEALQARLPQLKRLDPEAHDVARRVIAADGSWFNLAGEVACALEMNRGNGNNARQSRIRLNLQLDVEAFLPVDCDLSGNGDGSEAKAFIRRLKSGCIYVVDRNFVHFGFIDAVRAKGSNLVLRLKKDVKFKAIEDRSLAPKDQTHDVVCDQIGTLSGPTSKTNIGRNSRTGPPPAHGYRRIVVKDRKNQTDLILLTDLLDAPAWVIAELYRSRWQIELFLRWLKVFANFDHLISQSPRGMTMQFYVAVLLTLLLHLKTGLPVSKHTLHIVAMSAGGQLDDETLAMLLARRERERTLERLRRQKKHLP